MANQSAQRPTLNSRTIGLPMPEERYAKIVDQPAEVRRWLEESHEQNPELFPGGFKHGFEMKDRRDSKKPGLVIRRIMLRDGTAWSIRPSFVMPSMTARANDVSGPLFLRKFGVPFWALAHVFGRDPLFWYRLELALGRNSLVGTTVRRAEWPEYLLADEHHQRLRGQKTYLATTVAAGCYWGAELSDSAGTSGSFNPRDPHGVAMRILIRSTSILKCFNPRNPHGVAIFRIDTLAQSTTVSIHATRMGSRFVLAITNQSLRGGSIHATHMGSRCTPLEMIHRPPIVSIHATHMGSRCQKIPRGIALAGVSIHATRGGRDAQSAC